MLRQIVCGFIILYAGFFCALGVADPDNFIMPMPDAGKLFKSAADLSSQNPVSLLVTVVKNSNYPDSVDALNSSSGNFVSNPVQSVSNMLTGNGANNVGVGLSIHF